MRVDRAHLEVHLVERTPLTDHEGKSGATLERLVLDDGRRLVLKRLSPRTDLLMALTGDERGREYVLYSSGMLDRLPPGTGHALVGAWTEPDCTVLLMRDLGPTVLTWADRVDADRCRWLLARVAAMHDAFVGLDPASVPRDALITLPDLLGLFSPGRLAAHVRAHPHDENQLPGIALRGWDAFTDVVPADVADPVLALLHDITPLVAALESCPATLVHGDLATVNMAVETDQLTLIDWGMPAVAPGAVDVARFVAGCSSVVELSREEILAAYRAACGPSYDERAMRLALLSALAWLGWNKALDSVEHPEPATRAREKADLGWWVDRARETLQRDL
jgi:Phosphotransferase enzyme family